MRLPVKRAVLALVVLLGCLAMPFRPAEAALARNVGSSCAFGAGVLAAATYLEATPVLVSGALPLAAGSALLANALVGCGVSAAGAVASTVFYWVYDSLF